MCRQIYQCFLAFASQLEGSSTLQDSREMPSFFPSRRMVFCPSYKSLMDAEFTLTHGVRVRLCFQMATLRCLIRQQASSPRHSEKKTSRWCQKCCLSFPTHLETWRFLRCLFAAAHSRTRELNPALFRDCTAPISPAASPERRPGEQRKASAGVADHPFPHPLKGRQESRVFKSRPMQNAK